MLRHHDDHYHYRQLLRTLRTFVLSSQLSRHIHDVVSRILRDPDYAAEIRRSALAAVRGGARSEAFREYFEQFASTPGELSSLGQESTEGCACRSNTYLTVSSLVSPVPVCCNTTTTTTTSGDYFGVGSPSEERGQPDGR